MANFLKVALYMSTFCLTGALGQVNRTNAVLTVLEQTHDLIAFYNLFKSTGGANGIPEPAFEERFNDNNVGLEYTILAPTNEAIAKVHVLVEKLTKAEAYPLLASLLRTHILPGKLSPKDLYDRDIVAIEGFLIHTDANGAITTNPGVAHSDLSVGKQARLMKDSSGKPTQVPASNGVVYKIDNILDPMLTYFGEDSVANHTSLPAITISSSKLMKEILTADTQASRARELLQIVAPDFYNERLDLSYNGSHGSKNSEVIYLVPSNDALALFNYKAETSGNADATRFFLLAGFGKIEGNKLTGHAAFELKVEGGRVMNAAVEKRECGSNGCVWRIGRVIDSVYDLS